MKWAQPPKLIGLRRLWRLLHRPGKKTFAFGAGCFVVINVLISVARGASPILISEFRFRGPAGGLDEFVELINASTTNVNLAGWKLKSSSTSGFTDTIATNPAVVLAPGEHFLLASSGYTGPVPANQIYSLTIADGGGIGITTSNDVVMDCVGMSSTVGFREDNPLTTIDGEYESFVCTEKRGADTE